LNARELAALSPGERQEIRERVGRDLVAAGAHATIDTVADLLPVLTALNSRIRRGERPQTL
jgi:phosphonoacetaldehyde hydrolase